MSASNDHPSEPSLLRLLDGELRPEEADAVRRHVAACPQCSQALQTLSTVAAAVETTPSPEPLRPVWPLVRDRLEAAEKTRFHPAFALATAASVALGVGLGILLPGAEPTSAARDEAYLWSALGSNVADGTSGTVSGAWEGVGLESRGATR